jgi:hypothetical protein
MSASTRSALGLGAAAVLAGLALSGAAGREASLLQGVPTPAVAAAVALACATLVGLAGAGAGTLFLGLLPLPLFLLGGPLPGLRALTGPALLVPVLAGVLAALAAGERRLPAIWLGPILALVYGTVALRVQAQVGTQGDEPHYLIVAQSLLRDGDVAVEKDFAEGRYREFHEGPLEPHYRVRGRDGAIYSLHALGLSLLILPAFALAGYAGASLLLAGLAVLLALELRELLREVWDDADLATGVTVLLAFTPPLLHYAGLVFTEVPAALLTVVGLRRARRMASLQDALLVGLVLAGLPWLNVRYGWIAGVLLLLALSPRLPDRRRLAALLVPPLLSGLALLAYHQAIYGFADPRLVYGRRPEFSLGLVPQGLPGLFLDQEFGLLAYAPIFALAVPGLFRLLRRDLRCGLAVLALLCGVAGVASAWPMWRGGWNPPARFLVPILPALALAVAGELRRGLSAPAALLAAWGLWTGVGGALEPRLVHRDRDGTAPLFRSLSGAEEWTRLLPGFVLDESAHDRSRLALIWAGALGLAVAAASRARKASPAGLALATAGLAVAAGVASRASSAGTWGRDAVRVIGRPALVLPGGPIEPDSTARWTPADLDWGPAYEPHRHPGGAILGARLALPPGTYRLAIDAERLGPWTEGSLEIRGLQDRRVPLGQDLQATFEVSSPEREVTLAVLGGSALLVHHVDLARVGDGSTLPASSGLSR